MFLSKPNNLELSKQLLRSSGLYFSSTDDARCSLFQFPYFSEPRRRDRLNKCRERLSEMIDRRLYDHITMGQKNCDIYVLTARKQISIDNQCLI